MNRDNILILFFDLPSASAKEIYFAKRFRKCIVKNGYVFLQKSVYYKHVVNGAFNSHEIKAIKNLAPECGSIFIMAIPAKFFMKIKVVIGENIDFNRIFQSIIEIK